MISREQVDAALLFIGETDEQYAEAKAEVERCELRCKRARAFAYTATDSTAKVDDRKAKVEENERVITNETLRLDAFVAYEKLKAKRETQFLLIEVFRTLEATRRRETVV